MQKRVSKCLITCSVVMCFQTVTVSKLCSWLLGNVAMLKKLLMGCRVWRSIMSSLIVSITWGWSKLTGLLVWNQMFQRRWSTNMWKMLGCYSSRLINKKWLMPRCWIVCSMFTPVQVKLKWLKVQLCLCMTISTFQWTAGPLNTFFRPIWGNTNIQKYWEFMRKLVQT